jgi:broad specificity phosphatase PhoE
MFQRGPSSNALLRDKGEKQAKKFAAKLKKLSKMPDRILLSFFERKTGRRAVAAPRRRLLFKAGSEARLPGAFYP